jgi:hypothetical protein
MNTRIVRGGAAVTLCLLAGVAGSVATAQAGQPSNGCPNGYTLMAVADLSAQGYQVPGQVDDPTSGIKSFGSAGNGDGLICAQEIGHQTTSWGGQLYQFWDNTLRA